MSAQQLANLLEAIGSGPDLARGLCVGQWDLFDPQEAGECEFDAEQRHAAALELCAQCRELDQCRQYVDALPPRRRPRGVIAGRVVREPTHRNRDTGRAAS
jgi:hypothetical protein